MWVIAPDAASVLSVVALDAKKFPSVAERHAATQEGVHYVVLRMRVREDMEKTLELMAKACDVPVPLLDVDASADYKYRSVVPADWLSMYLASAVDSIDYTSHFKEASVKRSPALKGRYSALLSIWSSQEKLQDTPAYSGRRTSWPTAAASSGVSGYRSFLPGKSLTRVVDMPLRPGTPEDDTAPLRLDYSTEPEVWDRTEDAIDADLDHEEHCAFWDYLPCNCGARDEYDEITREEEFGRGWDEFPSLNPAFSAARASTRVRTDDTATSRQKAERQRKRQRKQSKGRRRGQGRG